LEKWRKKGNVKLKVKKLKMKSEKFKGQAVFRGQAGTRERLNGNCPLNIQLFWKITVTNSCFVI
jgi:hypothetical protein